MVDTFGFLQFKMSGILESIFLNRNLWQYRLIKSRIVHWFNITWCIIVYDDLARCEIVFFTVIEFTVFPERYKKFDEHWDKNTDQNLSDKNKCGKQYFKYNTELNFSTLLFCVFPLKLFLKTEEEDSYFRNQEM